MILNSKTNNRSGIPVNELFKIILDKNAVTKAPILVYRSKEINILEQNNNTITFPISSNECDK